MKLRNRVTKTGITCVLLVFAGFVVFASTAQAGTVDFGTLPVGLWNSSETPGVTITLEDGSGPVGTPFISGFPGICNGYCDDYPTANILDFTFSSPVTGLSFIFNNEGDNAGYNGDTTGTTFTAYDGSVIVFTGNLSDIEGALVSLPATDTITQLVINNNCGRSSCNGGNWWYDVSGLTFTDVSGTTFTPASSPTPEPSSLLLLGTGLLSLGPFLRRFIHS
jgi:hypothetical protein